METSCAHIESSQISNTKITIFWYLLCFSHKSHRRETVVFPEHGFLKVSFPTWRWRSKKSFFLALKKERPHPNYFGWDLRNFFNKIMMWFLNFFSCPVRYMIQEFSHWYRSNDTDTDTDTEIPDSPIQWSATRPKIALYQIPDVKWLISLPQLFFIFQSNLFAP